MIETSQVGLEPMQRPLGQSSSRPLRGTEWQRWELQADTARPRYPSLTGVGARKVLRNEEPRPTFPEASSAVSVVHLNAYSALRG